MISYPVRTQIPIHLLLLLLNQRPLQMKMIMLLLQVLLLVLPLLVHKDQQVLTVVHLKNLQDQKTMASQDYDKTDCLSE